MAFGGKKGQSSVLNLGTAFMGEMKLFDLNGYKKVMEFIDFVSQASRELQELLGLIYKNDDCASLCLLKMCSSNG